MAIPSQAVGQVAGRGCLAAASLGNTDGKSSHWLAVIPASWPCCCVQRGYSRCAPGPVALVEVVGEMVPPR